MNKNELLIKKLEVNATIKELNRILNWWNNPCNNQEFEEYYTKRIIELKGDLK